MIITARPTRANSSVEEHRAWWEESAPEGVEYGRCWCQCGNLTGIALRSDASKGWVKGCPKRYLPSHYRAPALDPQDRFLAMVDYSGACWEWTGYRDKKGYGRFNVDDTVPVLAHRFASMLAHGPIPEGVCVLHRCDNPPCVRPDHLWRGSRADNNRDMDEKGRRGLTGTPGESHHAAKLTEADVREIRRLYSTGRFGLRDLQALFGMSHGAIYAIVKGRNWKHVA